MKPLGLYYIITGILGIGAFQLNITNTSNAEVQIDPINVENIVWYCSEE